MNEDIVNLWLILIYSKEISTMSERSEQAYRLKGEQNGRKVWKICKRKKRRKKSES